MKNDIITLAHGAGGRLSREFVDAEILSRFDNGLLKGLPDAASLSVAGSNLVFTTDSFVVNPLFFPGGNIGELSVYGTVNDIAVSGGRPLFISLALIIEEGFAISGLRTILDSVKHAADDCGVAVATGDTKVVGRGQCDGVFINTAGIGAAYPEFSAFGVRYRETFKEGDHVLVSGTVGEHGMAVMAAREGVGIKPGPVSDCGPVHRLASAALPVGADIRFMRDPTRGGLAAVLNEITADSGFGILLDEDMLPISGSARAVAELLGLDILSAASEGRVVLICAAPVSEFVLDAWRKMPEGKDACRIGTVVAGKGIVTMDTLAGGRRIVDVPRGELLPRIC